MLKKVINKFISHRRLILIYFYLVNFIAGLDFNPNGEIAATIDTYGVCLISNVNTDSYRFHLAMEMKNVWREGKQIFKYIIIFQRLSSSAVSRIIRSLILIINYSLDETGRCRWSSNPDEPLLYVKYDRAFLNILDTEKKVLILKGPRCKIGDWGKHSRVLFLFFFFSIGKKLLILYDDLICFDDSRLK